MPVHSDMDLVNRDLFYKFAMEAIDRSRFITASHTDDDHLWMEWLHHEGDVDHLFSEDFCDPIQDTRKVDILTSDIEIRIFLYPYSWRDPRWRFEFPQ